MTEVMATTFDAVFNDPDFTTLFDEYAEESAVGGLPRPACQPDLYRQMEATGIMHVLAAYREGRLVGFLNLLVSVLPHYGVLIGTAESFFVGAAHRKQGGGLRLLRAAETLAKARGAAGMLISAPYGGKLSETMSKTKYTESNRIFFRGFT